MRYDMVFLSCEKLTTNMKQQIWIFIGLIALGILSSCGVGKQVSEAKTFGDCKYNLTSVDSVYLAGIDVKEFRNITEFSAMELARYPKLGLAFLRKDIPLDLRANIEITNPTRNKAAINQLEYKVLLSDSEIFSGFFNQKIEVYPGTGSTTVPIKLQANVYQLLNNSSTREEVINLIIALTGKSTSKPSKFVVKVKPTLDLAGKQLNYPGYITFEKEITAQMLLGAKP